MSILKTVALMVFAVLAVAQIAQAGTCRDPWVTQAITEVAGRAPNASGESGECNIYNFNGGQWSDYTQLKRAVRGYFARNPTYTQAMPTAASVNSAYNQSQIAGNANRASLIGDGGGTLIGHDGATLIGDGGGT
ncbi:MAG TPA: hypothetical protein PLY88_08335 [Candidatus Omnitrophota bacterium]|nr:hypothetical protein [Candidatus Omnitrophota bacterium]HRK62532.1 hypothetical protein [Candidatus Omnitrophota bacterium]